MKKVAETPCRSINFLSGTKLLANSFNTPRGFPQYNTVFCSLQKTRLMDQRDKVCFMGVMENYAQAELFYSPLKLRSFDV